MRHLRKVVLVLLTLFGLAAAQGCTGSQIAWHVQQRLSIAQEQDPAKKAELQSNYDAVVQAYDSWVADATAGEPCPQWFDAAMNAGFTVDHWHYPLAMIIDRESNCIPTANNRSSTADGLTQILDGTWRSSCPDIPISLKYDPQANLDCAYRVSGGGENWNPWATYP